MPQQRRIQDERSIGREVYLQIRALRRESSVTGGSPRDLSRSRLDFFARFLRGGREYAGAGILVIQVREKGGCRSKEGGCPRYRSKEGTHTRFLVWVAMPWIRRSRARTVNWLSKDRVIGIFKGAWKLSVYSATFSTIQVNLCRHAG